MSRELLSQKLKYHILFVVYSYLKNYRQFGGYSCDGVFTPLPIRCLGTVVQPF